MGRHRQVFPTVLAGALLLAAAVPSARAGNPQLPPAPVGSPPAPLPTTELRLLGGPSGGAGEATQSLLAHRLRLEAGVHGMPSAGWVEAAVSGLLVGSPTDGVWLRGGYTLQRYHYQCGDGPGSVNDDASTFDLGVAYRHRWASGSLFAAQAGAENLSRMGFSCNDSVLPSRSTGPRASIGGQRAFTRNLAFYGRIDVRGAYHIIEVGFLSEVWLGLAFEI